MKKAWLSLAAIITAFTLMASFYLPGYSLNRQESNGISIVYRSQNKSSGKIALTFDDGPHPIYTPLILDILQKYNVKATFFMVGENIALYTDAARRVYSEGHEIGNHTNSHPHLKNMDINTLLDEMLDCEDEIYKLNEYKPRIFRPPEGVLGKDVINAAELLEYDVILWSIDTRDWDNTPSETIVQSIVNNVKSGDIILMHDYIGHNSPTPTALNEIIPLLIAKGFEFVTISELI